MERRSRVFRSETFTPSARLIPVNATPTPEDLYRLFPEDRGASELVPLTPDEMPEPYRQLLVHTHHMTVTVEGFYGQPVDVRVLDSMRTYRTYCRRILLSLKETGEVVQFGIIEVNLAALSDTVRGEIVAGKTPLGRVLIENNVLRSIQPVSYFRVWPGVQLCEWFNLPEPQTTYGRVGIIFTGDQPAIEVLEILAPVSRTSSTPLNLA